MRLKFAVWNQTECELLNCVCDLRSCVLSSELFFRRTGERFAFTVEASGEGLERFEIGVGQLPGVGEVGDERIGRSTEDRVDKLSNELGEEFFSIDGGLEADGAIAWDALEDAFGFESLKGFEDGGAGDVAVLADDVGDLSFGAGLEFPDLLEDLHFELSE